MRYFILPWFKMDSFGSPFRNVRSGLAEDDEENNKRFKRGIDAYVKQFKSKFESSPLLGDHELDQPDVFTDYAHMTFPAVLGISSYVFLRIYTSPSSFFIRKLGVSFFVLAGVYLGLRHQIKKNNIFMLRHFHMFSKDVQYALKSGDARYLRHILHDLDFAHEKVKPVAHDVNAHHEKAPEAAASKSH